MKIIVDGFGGDNAPACVCEGAALAVKELGVSVSIVGDTDRLRSVFSEKGLSEDGIDFVPAPDVIGMEDEPTEIIRSKADSSMAVGLRLLAEGKGDAFVSAGSTGALLAGATLIVKRLKGVKRPAIGVVVPGGQRPYLLLDAGANVECRPEMLNAFAVMGSAYAQNVLGRQNPTVGLVNNGAEDTKGTPV